MKLFGVLEWMGLAGDNGRRGEGDERYGHFSAIGRALALNSMLFIGEIYL